jgi:Na+/H+-translocating membrane pyrophosphatase
LEESLATLYKRTSATLAEETQALVKSEVLKQVRANVVEEIRRQEARDQEILTETIRADYLSKMIDLERNLRHDQVKKLIEKN